MSPTNANTTDADADTRTRILRAATKLFRKQGYHGTGLADVLAAAQAPKGSLYHHFPGGKEAIGVAVIESINAGVLQLMAASRARSTQALMKSVGEQLSANIKRTRHELCTLFSGFAAERTSSPQLAQALEKAYGDLAGAIEAHLAKDGFAPAAAKERALLVLALLEGGAMLAQAQQRVHPFDVAVKHAVTLCAKTSS
jgi:TetR/AcrR family transcriptional repressor of lmrAB and yxaGH operons